MKQRVVLKVGDIVELKSGSPKMTATEVIALGKVRCSWFVGNKYMTNIFPSKALKISGRDPAMLNALELVYGKGASSRLKT